MMHFAGALGPRSRGAFWRFFSGLFEQCISRALYRRIWGVRFRVHLKTFGTTLRTWGMVAQLYLIESHEDASDPMGGVRPPLEIVVDVFVR